MLQVPRSLERTQHARDPLGDRTSDGWHIGREAVIRVYELDFVMARGHGPTKRIASTLHDQRRHRDVVQLVLAAFLRLAYRVEWERQAQRRCGLPALRRPTGHPGSRRAATEDLRQSDQWPIRELLGHRQPRLVQLLRRRGRSAAGHPVRLFDEYDVHPCGLHRVRHRDQVFRAKTTAGAVAEKQCRGTLFGVV